MISSSLVPTKKSRQPAGWRLPLPRHTWLYTNARTAHRLPAASTWFFKNKNKRFKASKGMWYVFNPPLCPSLEIALSFCILMFKVECIEPSVQAGKCSTQKQTSFTPCANFNGHAVKFRGLEAGPALDPQTAATALSSTSVSRLFCMCSRYIILFMYWQFPHFGSLWIAMLRVLKALNHCPVGAPARVDLSIGPRSRCEPHGNVGRLSVVAVD